MADIAVMSKIRRFWVAVIIKNCNFWTRRLGNYILVVIAVVINCCGRGSVVQLYRICVFFV